ncbi:flavodoxin family protein [Selenomonadales bacterium OttesenSCG-928-I06]|nr:flavodoxin family protein [Selenomonadales bacterium OttesenSCG-928-I06]
MKKNILVISGSPRVGGNSDALAEAFIEGVKKAGHNVELFQAGQKNIKGCMGCEQCYSKETACVVNDDFNELAPMLEKADTIIWVTPVYYFTFTASIKAAIDKMYAFAISGRSLQKKQHVARLWRSRRGC